MLTTVIFFELGSAVEPSFFEGMILWQGDNAPHIILVLDNIKVKDVEFRHRNMSYLSNYSVSPMFLEQYAFLKDYMPPEYKKEYGYQDGVKTILKAIETVELIRG